MSEAKQVLLSTIVGGANWITRDELSSVTGYPGGTISPLLNELVSAGDIQKIKPPAGFAPRAQWIYGAPALSAPSVDAPPASTKRKRQSKRTVGFRAEARARRKRGQRARSTHCEHRSRIVMRKEKTHGSNKPSGELIVLKPRAARWALTSDGAFVNLTTHDEIGRSDAAALLSFVATLRKGKA